MTLLFLLGVMLGILLQTIVIAATQWAYIWPIITMVLILILVLYVSTGFNLLRCSKNAMLRGFIKNRFRLCVVLCLWIIIIPYFHLSDILNKLYDKYNLERDISNL